MATDIVMPRLSDSMAEGTILNWMKSVGDEVALGEELVEIETDKANMVYESDAVGTLIEILANEGETLPIGAVIARVADSSQASAAGDGNRRSTRDTSAVQPWSASPNSRAHEAAEPELTVSRDASPTEQRDGGGRKMGGRLKASPLARRLAKEKGVVLSSLKGSGSGGRIIKLDVEAAASGTAPAASARASAGATLGLQEKPEAARRSVEVVELTKLQQTVSRRMVESKATVPHFYLRANVAMGAALEARERIKAAAPQGSMTPSVNDVIVKACAVALRDFPRANGAYRAGKWELYSRINIGIAVAAHEALVVPTVFDADLKGLQQIATETRELAARVREGTITPQELSGGTFTVSNLGMYGISSFDAVINSPQAAILAVGAIIETPVVRDGQITSAPLMGVTLACDHRILYGAEGAEFLGRVRALLEEPMSLAL